MKKITVFMIIAMMLFLTACGTQKKASKPTVPTEVKATVNKSEPTQKPTVKATERPTQAPTNPPTEAPTNPPTEKPKDTAWKNLYLDYLDSIDTSQFSGFQLIYIDNDDIPELIVQSSTHLIQSVLCWVNNGKMCQDNISFSGFAYLERQNKYLCEEGYTGKGYDYIRRISGSEAEEIMRGELCTVQGNEYYRWDGVDYSSQNEYNTAKVNDFDKSAAKTVDNLKSYTDICKQIQEH